MTRAPALRVARLTVDQVEAMIEAGILAEGEAIELIDGVLVCKDRSARGEDPITTGKRHDLVVKLLAQLDVELADRGSHMQTQGPLRITAFDRLGGRLRSHKKPHPIADAIVIGPPATRERWVLFR